MKIKDSQSVGNRLAGQNTRQQRGADPLNQPKPAMGNPSN